MTALDRATKVRVVLGVAFTGAGIAHIVKHDWFEQLVPESLARWRKPISAVTAVIQLVGGMSMFIPRCAAWPDGPTWQCWCPPCRQRWLRPGTQTRCAPLG
jgi:uncharacterized membrane protein